MAEQDERGFLYMITDVPWRVQGEEIEAYLQDAGMLGWELVSVHAVHNDYRYVFKMELGRARGGRPPVTW